LIEAWEPSLRWIESKVCTSEHGVEPNIAETGTDPRENRWGRRRYRAGIVPSGVSTVKEKLSYRHRNPRTTESRSATACYSWMTDVSEVAQIVFFARAQRVSFPSESFYENVLPQNQVHLGWSSFAKVWLNRIPMGFHRLSGLVQTKLQESPFSGHVSCFVGRRGDLIKVLWWDGDGLCNPSTENPQYRI
jgi:hypothetical protein